MKQNNYIINFIKVTFISLLLIATSPVRAEIKVVTTIKPLHSLVANVMQGVGEPSLIIEGSTSPHSFTLKPSHAKLLEEADLIFWFGEGIETFMERPLESIVKNAEVVEFIEVESIEKLKFREESIFDDHDDHDDHTDHDEEAHDDHDEEGHDDHDDHNHGEFDAHIWLDPSNAKQMVREIAHELGDLDPTNKDKYEANAEATILTLDELIYNVGTGKGRKISDLVKQYGFDLPITEGDPCEMKDNTADNANLLKLGWSPKEDLDKYLKGKLNGDTNNEEYIQGLLSKKLRVRSN